MKYIEDNKLEIIDYPRECYIDGIWNKEINNSFSKDTFYVLFFLQ